jgi:hypothetical protein
VFCDEAVEGGELGGEKIAWTWWRRRRRRKREKARAVMYMYFDFVDANTEPLDYDRHIRGILAEEGPGSSNERGCLCINGGLI